MEMAHNTLHNVIMYGRHPEGENVSLSDTKLQDWILLKSTKRSLMNVGYGCVYTGSLDDSQSPEAWHNKEPNNDPEENARIVLLPDLLCCLAWIQQPAF